MRKRKNVEQEYLNPHNCSRVFDDGTLVSYSIERRAWVVCKDGFELILRDTVMPQPEEVIAFMDSRDLFRASENLKSLLAHIFPDKQPEFYRTVEAFLSEALLGVIETPHGGVPTYDLAHLTSLFGDIERNIDKTAKLLEALVAGSCAYKSAYFLVIPPTKFDDEEGDLETI